MYDLGSKLKLIRQQRCLTQRDLAQRINKSVSAVSSYESNAQLPPLDVLESLALALHVSIDYIVGMDENCTYTTQNLTPKQAEVIELLFQEFTSSEKKSIILSANQILIIQKLVNLFTETKENTL